MSEQKTWVEALNIDPDKLAKWSEEVPEGTPLLFYCLERGYVMADQYLDWARENFQLPVLSSEFFSKALDKSAMPADRSPGGTWNVSCFPVAKWDGVTFVACVEPPRETPTGHFVFVLADPRTMASVWNETAVTAAAKSVDPSSLNLSVEMPEGMASKAAKPFQLNFDPSTIVAGDHGQQNAEEVSSPVIPFSAPPPAPPASPVATADAGGPPDAGQELQEIELAFRQLKEVYISSMIMKLEGNVVSLYKWSPEFDLSSVASQAKVDLAGPSLFRIVAKTKLPYHGFVVDSPVHRDFFKVIGYDKLPACVTAIPIKIDDNIWGLLVAIGNEASQRPKPLQIAENVVEKLKSSLAGVWTVAA